MACSWRVVTASVPGCHERNQDAAASRVVSGPDGSEAVLVALADGHGSPSSFRSATGAHFACLAALDVLESQAAQVSPDPESGWEGFIDELPLRILAAWNERVDDDLSENPVTNEEVVGLLERTSSGEVMRVLGHIVSNHRIIYGATMLAVAVVQNHCLAMHVGDGDIIAVDGEGNPHWLVEPDRRFVGEETASLCVAEAEDFRCRVTVDPQVAFRFLMLATDGYAKSFRTDELFLGAVRDYDAYFSDVGVAAVEAALPRFLQDTSRRGSKDDTTVAFLLGPLVPPEVKRPSED